MHSNTVAYQSSQINHNVSKIVRILMAVAGMGQNHLAVALDMDKASLSKALSGQRRWTLDDIVKLSEVFDRPLSYFFEPADTIIRNRCFREPQLVA
jgi:transcriptional regulator with XRE-family HTH domain